MHFLQINLHRPPSWPYSQAMKLNTQVAGRNAISTRRGPCCISLPTCNLLEIIHNIWLQQYGKRGACLYVATLDDYVQTFKQSALCYVFLHGSHYKIRLDRDELWLCKTSQSNDHDFTNGYCSHQISFGLLIYIKILHLEGEKVFGSTKWMQDLSLWSEGDLHKHDYIIFSCPWMEFNSHNFTPDVNVG
jgi:hypothetical protein